jgi:hypothetical protein
MLGCFLLLAATELQTTQRVLLFPSVQLNGYQYTAFMEETARRQSMTHDLRRLTNNESFKSNGGAGGGGSGCSSSLNRWLGSCWGSQTYVTPAWWSLLVRIEMAASARWGAGCHQQLQHMMCMLLFVTALICYPVPAVSALRQIQVRAATTKHRDTVWHPKHNNSL